MTGRVAAAALAGVLLAGCGGAPTQRSTPEGAGSTVPTLAGSATPAPTPAPGPAPTPVPEPAVQTPGPAVSDGTPQEARLSIDLIGVEDLVVVPYVGFTDDAAGTDLQNEGDAASPHGPRGGVGPGGVGNYQVTAHRNSAGAPFFALPDLTRGDEVSVRAGSTTYVYRIVRTRETSFRSAQSLREQRAAVPGRPGVAATRAMITLSTCATQEDHAAGNYWADEFDNPEHRIDKIGVLVRTRAA